MSPASPQYKSEELAVQILDSNAKYVVSVSFMGLILRLEWRKLYLTALSQLMSFLRPFLLL